MADRIKNVRELKLVAKFSDGDDRTLSFDNPKATLTTDQLAAQINEASAYAKTHQVILGDKIGAEFVSQGIKLFFKRVKGILPHDIADCENTDLTHLESFRLGMNLLAEIIADNGNLPHPSRLTACHRSPGFAKQTAWGRLWLCAHRRRIQPDEGSFSQKQRTALRIGENSPFDALIGLWQQPQQGLPYGITLRSRWRGFHG